MKNSTDFLISGLPAESFEFLFDLNDAQLKERAASRMIADSRPGCPCRVSLVDAEIGETVILLTYAHHPVEGPYSGTGPIFVRRHAGQARLRVNEIPEVVAGRLMSVRAYDSSAWLVASEVVQGADVERQIRAFFSDERVSYLHLHNAKPGCYSCRVDRA